MGEEELEPPLDDGYGYRAKKSDLELLGLTLKDIVDFRERMRPLGMVSELFDVFCSSLERAIKRDGLNQVDIRLQGSAAHFFSGHHKSMPYAREEVLECFLELRGRKPFRGELDLIMSRLSEAWPPGRPRPHRRPFDSMHRLGIDKYPSDYDVQLSSDDIYVRAVEILVELGVDPSDALLESTEYGFIRKYLVVEAIPNVTQWAVLMSDVLRRPVTIAAFPSCGPTPVDGRVSSHFRETDWCLMVGGAAG